MRLLSISRSGLLILFVFPLLFPLLFQAGCASSRRSSDSASSGASRPPSFTETRWPRPKLILLLVIDQFRADYLTRFEGRFLPPVSKGKVGGFRYLMTRGAYYPAGQYELLQSMTCPGHATISTGAYPYLMGIPINSWFDSTAGKPVYCVEDRDEPEVGAPNADPRAGMSPRNLIADTFGDELKNAGYPSRVVSVALKDRAAILLGGHRADLALWFDGGAYRWVSSRYYLPTGRLPAWVKGLNSEVERAVQRAGNSWVEWKPAGQGSGYSDEKTGMPFDHRFKPGSPETLASPYGDTLTVDAAERAFDQYQLGLGPGTDVLEVSFSSHDMVGHQFGPNSREMEEMTVHEDSAIAELLNHVKRAIPGGLDPVAIVFTADHGIPGNPDYLLAHRQPSGRINPDAVNALIERALTARFGRAGRSPWVAYSNDLQIYLNRALIRAKRLSLSAVQAQAKAAVVDQPWALRVFTASEIQNGELPDGMLRRQAERDFVPGRSGDLVIVPRPYFFAGVGHGVNHHTGFSYDRTVPIILSGEWFRAAVFSNRADVVDIAPTLSFLSGTVPPDLSEGRVLSESFKRGLARKKR